LQWDDVSLVLLNFQSLLMPPWYSLAFLVVAGFVAGFYGVNVGSSSLITIPALIFTGMPTPLVIATNRFAIVWAELAGVIGFKKRVKFDLSFALLCGVVGALGAYAGSRVVLVLNQQIVSIVIAVLLLAVAIFLLLRRDFGSGGSRIVSWKKVLVVLLMPFIGFYAGFFGTSHGTFTLMILTAFGMGFFEGVAVIRVIGVMVAVTAALSFLQAGAIQWPQAIALSIGVLAGSTMGVRYSIRRGVGVIRILLIVVAIASSLKLLWGVVHP
jgi:uncharacterized membrane protein YfcA